MARPPAGPMGNSPRDVRDDAVGIPAENVNAPEPPRWPPKRKKITGDTFHAKASGSKAPKRADRPPTFRRGGMVNRFASGGSVEDRREDKPGEKKNDPFAKQNLKGGGGVKKKLADGGVTEDDRETGKRILGAGMRDSQGPFTSTRRNLQLEDEYGKARKATGLQGKADGGGLRSEMTQAEKARRTLRSTPPVTVMEDLVGRASPSKGADNAVRDAVREGASDTIKGSGYQLENKGVGRGYDFKKKGGAVKRADGGPVPTPKPDPRYSIGDEKNLSPGTAEAWKAQMGRIRSIERGDEDRPSKSEPLPRKSGGGLKK